MNNDALTIIMATGYMLDESWLDDGLSPYTLNNPGTWYMEVSIYNWLREPS